jgi:type I restriction enzyme S subunit
MSSENAKLVPKLRFPEFRSAGGWTLRELGDCLDYLQPTQYLVNSTAYNDNYEIPVVTAGKTFILGHTDETEGVFDQPLPVVIFDDFTTATQYVDFRFKAKSSAMKILLAKQNANIKFIYESIQQIDYEVGAHGRHWISAYSKIKVAIPKLDEQQKISDCLSSLDELIAALARKVGALKTHKKGLMQQLFPREGETQPRLRFPEFQGAGEWTPTALGSIASFSSGGTPSKDNPEYWNGSIPWVSASSMYELHISKADHYVTPLAIGNGTRIAKKGTLLILVRGSMLFKRVPMCIAAVDVAFNQDVKALKIDPSIIGTFLIYQLLTNEARIPINETGIGAGKIELTDLKEFGLFIPSQPEQCRIADSLTNLDDLITAATQELDTLKTHKKGLMQQLFPSAAAVET